MSLLSNVKKSPYLGICRELWLKKQKLVNPGKKFQREEKAQKSH